MELRHHGFLVLGRLKVKGAGAMKKINIIMIAVSVVILLGQGNLKAAGLTNAGAPLPVQAMEGGWWAALFSIKADIPALSAADKTEKVKSDKATADNIESLTREFFRDIPPVDDYDWSQARHNARVQQAFEKAI